MWSDVSHPIRAVIKHGYTALPSVPHHHCGLVRTPFNPQIFSRWYFSLRHEQTTRLSSSSFQWLIRRTQRTMKLCFPQNGSRKQGWKRRCEGARDGCLESRSPGCVPNPRAGREDTSGNPYHKESGWKDERRRRGPGARIVKFHTFPECYKASLWLQNQRFNQKALRGRKTDRS